MCQAWHSSSWCKSCVLKSCQQLASESLVGVIASELRSKHPALSVPEQGGGKLIPEGMCNPGQVYTVSRGKSGMIGVFRLESQMLPGNGKFERTGIGSDRDCKEATNTAFNFLKANSNRISGTLMKVEELTNTLQVCLDAGAKKVLLPATCFTDLQVVPVDLATAFDFIYYKSAEEAVRKALGVE